MAGLTARYFKREIADEEGVFENQRSGLIPDKPSRTLSMAAGTQDFMYKYIREPMRSSQGIQLVVISE